MLLGIWVLCGSGILKNQKYKIIEFYIMTNTHKITNYTLYSYEYVAAKEVKKHKQADKLVEGR